MSSLISRLAPSRAVLRMLPVAALLSLSVGSGCKKKGKKGAEKDAPVAKKAEEKKTEKRAAPAAAGAGWLGLVSLMPEGSNSVLGLHVDALRKSPFWKDIEGAMGKDDDGKKVLAAMKRCGLSYGDLSRVAVGGGTDGFGSGALVLSGKEIGDAKKIKCILDAAKAEAKARGKKIPGELYTTAKKDGFDVYTLDGAKLDVELGSGGPQGKIHLIAVDAGRVVVAQEKHLAAVMNRLKPKALPVVNSLSPIKEHLNPSGAVVVMGLPDKNMKNMLSSNGVDGLRSFRAAFDLKKGVGLKLSLDMEKKEQATATAKMIDTKLNEQKPMLAFLSLPPTLLDSLKVVANGSSVDASLQLSSKEVGAVRSVVEKQAAAAAGGAP